MIKDGFIGKKIKVIDAKNPSNIGIEGVVIDETENMFIIKNHETKKIVKQNVTIKIGNDIIEGRKLVKRPEERIKE